MTTRTLTLAVVATAATIGLSAGTPASAYEPNSILVQLMGSALWSDASGSAFDGVNYDSGSVTYNPTLNLSYFVTSNFALQTVLAVPVARVDLNTPDGRVKATEQYVLPLSLIAQWHFFSDGPVSPFVGAGGTYAIFWEKDSKLGSHVGLNNTWGGLVNAGVNFHFPDSNWLFSLDIKKWWLADTNVRVGGDRIDDLSVNPLFIGVGVGYRFSL